MNIQPFIELGQRWAEAERRGDARALEKLIAISGPIPDMPPRQR